MCGKAHKAETAGTVPRSALQFVRTRGGSCGNQDPKPEAWRAAALRTTRHRRPRDERALANSGANAGFKQGSDQGGRRPCEGDRVYQAVHPKGLWPGNHVLRAETSCPCPPQTLSLPGSSETTLSTLMELVVTPRGE